MTRITRRALGIGTLALAMALSVVSLPAMAEQVKTLKIGFQKTNLPVIARQQHVIEDSLQDLGVGVEWVEFSSGPPLVEALNVGAVHVGWTGDAPPIFGQAAGAAIVYVAALPSAGLGEGIVAKSDSGIATVADLKGKKVAVGKGTSAHNLLVAALEANGLAFTDIEPIYLSPADAGAAFASNNVDAWSIWDPFLAIAEVQHKPNVLVRSPDVLDVHTFFLANRDFTTDNAEVIDRTVAALAKAAEWADANRDKVAQTMHEVTGVPIEAQTLAADRAQFGIYELSPEVIASQQQTADRFFKLGLIPTEIRITDAIWTKPES